MVINEKLMAELRCITGWSVDKINSKFTKLGCNIYDAKEVFLATGRLPNKLDELVLNNFSIEVWHNLFLQGLFDNKKNIMKKIDLEEQYQLYLGRVALRESTMNPEQKLQLRDAFFGAIGQFLVLTMTDIVDLSEEDACRVLDDIEDQVSQHFLSRTINQKHIMKN